MKINREARRLVVTATGVSNSTLFGSDFPLIAPDRWLKDFNGASFKPEVHPLIPKQNAIRLLGLHTEEKKDAT